MKGMPCWKTPISIPAMMLMAVIRIVARESRWLNRLRRPLRLKFASWAICRGGCGLVFVDQSGVEVGVDCHLLAGHGVQGEARCDLGRSHRAMADDHVLNRNQCQKKNEAHDIVAADDELAEGLDDASGGGRRLHCREAESAGCSPDPSDKRNSVIKSNRLGNTENCAGLKIWIADKHHEHRGGHTERQQEVDEERGNGISMTNTMLTAAAGINLTISRAQPVAP